MPNLKKPANKKVTYRRMVTLNPDTGKRVETLARQDHRSTAAMLRILVEHGLTAIAK